MFGRVFSHPVSNFRKGLTEINIKRQLLIDYTAKAEVFFSWVFPFNPFTPELEKYILLTF